MASKARGGHGFQFDFVGEISNCDLGKLSREIMPKKTKAPSESPNGRKNELSEQGEELTPLPAGGHLKFRKCANCGSLDMTPDMSFHGTGLDGATDHGLNYKCPNCHKEIQIKDSGALFMGAMYSLFWGAVAYWVFLKGPYWYIKHASIILDNDFVLSYFLADVFVVLLSLAIIFFSTWIVWTFLLGPLTVLLQYPITHENRERSEKERSLKKSTRTKALVSFFILPLALWFVLIAIIWGLDFAGIDVREGFVKYVAIIGLLGFIGLLSKRIGANAIYAFVGMAFWLAIFLFVVFGLKII